MTMKYIRDYYGVPAKRGMRVAYTDSLRRVVGTITGSRNGYLRIRIDGNKRVEFYHPTFGIEYLVTGQTHSPNVKSNP